MKNPGIVGLIITLPKYNDPSLVVCMQSWAKLSSGDTARGIDAEQSWGLLHPVDLAPQGHDTQLTSHSTRQGRAAGPLSRPGRR